MDLIIKESDPRYKDLNKLLSYNLKDLVYKDSERSWYYYIPPELVLWEEGLIKKNPESPMESWENYIYCRQINWIEYYCEITAEDFFCLFELHINDRDLRPKCNYCKTNYLSFVSLSQGYGRYGDWNPLMPHYCCNECQRYGHEEHNKEILNGAVPTIKRMRTMFLSYGNEEDSCILYATYISDGRFKYGVTTTLESRKHSISYNGFYYVNPKILFKGTRLQVANLEAWIKLDFEAKEYLEKSSEFFKSFRKHLKDHPNINPFESDQFE